MVYVVKVNYLKFVFNNAVEAMKFAEVAKNTGGKDKINKTFDVEIDIYTEDEYKAEFDLVENKEEN